MDFWNKLIGSTTIQKKPAPKTIANDPAARLQRFQRVYEHVIDLCNRKRDLSTEGPLLWNLHLAIERIATLLREESRAPAPHTCIQYAGGKQIYNVVAKAATVSQSEPVIRSSIAVFAALVDSEEEDFLNSGHFAKSLMRLVMRVADSGSVLITSETETSVLELLFTITAKIRLQPEILPVWFQASAKRHTEDVFEKEKSFVGSTQKDDFPLTYLLVDRVHHEGRTGDFARTGLLYVFEATGRSLDLEEWVVSSDLPTLMATGLGALYSQLSRELSILHPDATLPAVLAMSDYTTTHPRATAESAFSERHRAHMTTFLSYLAFWQDVLDHCRSDDVKQTLLDHFQILFLQQLLYPSLLQSSDTDAGSSVAVLTYMTSILEALEYPDLLHMMLTYLLAIQEDAKTPSPSSLEIPRRSSMPPRSPNSVKRRQSLMLLSASKDADDIVDPNLFSLVDLITNNLSSSNSQSVYAALKLASTLLVRQRRYAFGTLLKVQKATASTPTRTAGALQLELERYSQLAASLHEQHGLGVAYDGLCEDLRYSIEAQLPLKPPDHAESSNVGVTQINTYMLNAQDTLMRTIKVLLQTFFTNSVDVNLALSEAVIAIAQCAEVRLDDWLALAPSSYRFDDQILSSATRSWQSYIDSEDESALSALQASTRIPKWPDQRDAPMLYEVLQTLLSELDHVRTEVPNLDQLISGRKNMLQAASLDAEPSEPVLQVNNTTPQITQSFEIASDASWPVRNSSRSLPAKTSATVSPDSATSSVAGSRAASRTRKGATSTNASSPSIITQTVFQPPPPDSPSTTDMLMKVIEFPAIDDSNNHVTPEGEEEQPQSKRTSTLNHVLTNVVVLQEFVLELVAVLQVRAAVLGEQEVRVA